MVVKGENNQDSMIIFHIQEAGSEKFKYDKFSFYEEVLSKIGLTKVEYQDLIEVYINGYKETGPSQSAPSPGSLYRNQDLVKITNRCFHGYFKGRHNETQGQDLVYLRISLKEV